MAIQPVQAAAAAHIDGAARPGVTPAARQQGLSPNLDHARGVTQVGARAGAQASAQAGARPSAWNRADQIAISTDSRAMNRLSSLWGAMSWLFGPAGGLGGTGPGGAPAWPFGPAGDGGAAVLDGLRRTLAEARRNAAVAQTKVSVMETLKDSVLREAEALVEKYYGLAGDGSPLRITFDDHMDGALASVSFRYDERGRMADQVLHLNMSELTPDTGPNGVNGHIIQNDRIIAHEMTHAIMGRNMDMSSLPDWFAEGTAEYIAGAAERVGLVLQRRSPRQMLGSLLQPWDGGSVQYAAGYLAVHYLDEATAANGGLRAIMGRLHAGDSLDEAIATVSGGGYRNTSDFLHAFVIEGEGQAFLRTVDLSGRDAGSIRPGPGYAVLPDRVAPSSQPLHGFRVVWPSPLEGLSFGGGMAPGDGTPTPWGGYWDPAALLPRATMVAAYRQQVAVRDSAK